MKAHTILRSPKYGILLAVFFALAAAAASADVTYTYTSSPYTSWTNFASCPPSQICQTTGTVTFANALPDNMAEQAVTPLSFSFTDGITVLDNTNSTMPFPLELGTNSSG